MSDIAELERRITAALDRAAQAMDRLGVASSDGGDVEVVVEPGDEGVAVHASA